MREAAEAEASQLSEAAEAGAAEAEASVQSQAKFMCGLYYRFNNLRFTKILKES